jgi:carbamoyltransferase
MLEQLLGVKVRQAGEPVRHVHMDVAASLQRVTQNTIMSLLCELHRLTRQENLVMAGGIALNSVANGLIRERTPFQNVFIQPAAHDAGLALGAALLLAHAGRRIKAPCEMRSPALGPAFSDEEIHLALTNPDEKTADLTIEHSAHIAARAARLLADGKVVAWFQGKLEFGPRALGQRSILADPRDPTIQDWLNRIKRREPFRPFAAAVLYERLAEWFSRATESPFMLLVDTIREPLRDRVPGVQHCDGTVRLQTVRADRDPLFHRLISVFFELTGVPLVLNTSLNVQGEPLACTPEDALRAFTATSIDALAIGNYLVTRPTQSGAGLRC